MTLTLRRFTTLAALSTMVGAGCDVQIISFDNPRAQASTSTSSLLVGSAATGGGASGASDASSNGGASGTSDAGSNGGAAGSGGGGNGGGGGQPKPPPDGPFVVSDYFGPTAGLGDGATFGNLVVDPPGMGCKERPAGARGDCYHFQYIASQPYTTPVTKSTGVCNWAGVSWQYPDHNFGAMEGLPIPSGKLTKVSFQVAVASGVEAMTFQIGGVGIPPLADGGVPPPPPSACPPSEGAIPPFFDEVSNTALLMIGPEWQKVEIPLQNRDPDQPLPSETKLIGAFMWALASVPGLPKTIFVDDIVYE